MYLLVNRTPDYRVQLCLSCLCSTSSSTTRATLGGSTAKLFGPVLQLPIKSAVSIDATILSGLSENNIVLSDTLFNSSVA
jgi:hypothetical protein